MANRTDQEAPRHVGDRVAPPTTPDRESIKQDRAAMREPHEPDRMPTPEEEAAAERAGDVDPEVAQRYKEAAERGAAQQGEGRPGL